MENISNNIQQPASDEISLKELLDKIKTFLKYLKTKWLQLFIAGIVGGLLGLGYYYIQSPKYEAVCTFVLDEKNVGGGGLSSLASNFGIDVGGILGGGGSLFANDNLLDILQSRRIVETVLLSEVDTAKNTHITLADLYLEFSKLKKKYDKKERTVGVHYYGYADRNKLSPIQDSILYDVYKRVLKNNFSVDRTNKKTQIFKISINSKSEVFCKLMAERVAEETKKLYITVKTGTLQRNVDRLQTKADSLLSLLNGKSYELAETQIVNPNPAIKTIGLPTKFAARNELVIGTLYTEIVKNLETAKTSLMLQTPVIQNLDTPKLPLENSKKGLFTLFFVGAVLAFCLISLNMSIKYLIDSSTA
ncbi:MAG: hypothetical protein JST94_08540 [Bacteroidetes bacterium]|nr:hypothetical protein [Bacteroidota bacterium]